MLFEKGLKVVIYNCMSLHLNRCFFLFWKTKYITKRTTTMQLITQNVNVFNNISIL